MPRRVDGLVETLLEFQDSLVYVTRGTPSRGMADRSFSLKLNHPPTEPDSTSMPCDIRDRAIRSNSSTTSSGVRPSVLT
jgi:hypothetical protein